MVEVREKMEKSFEDGKMVPGTRSSHDFISQSASQIGQTVQWGWLICGHPWFQNSNLSWYWQHCNIVLHLLHVHFSLWWVGLVNKVNDEQGDVDVQFIHLHGQRKTFNWPQSGDSCYFPIKNIICTIQAPTINHWKNLQNLWWRL